MNVTDITACPADGCPFRSSCVRYQLYCYPAANGDLSLIWPEWDTDGCPNYWAAKEDEE